MKNSEKKMLLIIGLIAVVVIVGLLIWKNAGSNNGVVQGEENRVEEFVQKLDDGSKLNISEELQKNKKLDGLEITNIQLREIGNITTLLAKVSNNTGKATSERRVKVEVLDKSGNVITTLRGIIDKIPSGGSVQLNMSVTSDVANAYDFRISNM